MKTSHHSTRFPAEPLIVLRTARLVAAGVAEFVVMTSSDSVVTSPCDGRHAGDRGAWRRPHPFIRSITIRLDVTQPTGFVHNVTAVGSGSVGFNPRCSRSADVCLLDLLVQESLGRPWRD